LKAAKIHHFSKLTVNTQYFLHKDTKKESDIGALHHKNNLSVIIKWYCAPGWSVRFSHHADNIKVLQKYLFICKQGCSKRTWYFI